MLLRQDSYKALTEPVKFRNQTARPWTPCIRRGSVIEQRFYATTAKGRALYDRCLAEADAAREKNPAWRSRISQHTRNCMPSPSRRFPRRCLNY